MDFTLANAGRATAPDPLDIFGEHPWDVAQRQKDEAQANWWQDNRQRADEAFLDPQKAFPDIEQGFADSVDTQRMLAANDDLLRLYRDGEDPPADDFGRYLDRLKIATMEFNGEGAESEEEFFAAAQKHATKRVDEREFSKKLRAFAADDASLPTGDGPGLAVFMKIAATMPGFDPDKAADYAEEWAQSRAELNERIAPIREPLQHVWRAFRTGVEPGKDILASIPDDQFSDFLNLLRLRAETLGDEEKESFLAGMRKDFGRQVENYYRQAGESVSQVGLMGTAGPYSYMMPQDREQQAADMREFDTGRNRAHEVRRIFSSTYDPIDYVKGLGWAQKIPGVTVTSMTMAVPGAGTPMMFGSMMGAAQESAYLKARDAGMSEDAAGSYASAIAPAIAIPQSILEKVGFGIWTRKLPAFNSLLTRMDDAIVNRGLRFATKTGTIGAAETGIEVTQDLTENLVQDIAGALNSDLPDVDWGTELKGAWNSVPEIFGSMVVLSMFGAAGGLNTEARAAAFQSASDRELKAAGYIEADIISIRNAKGPASLIQAIEAAQPNRDANSPEAKAAAEAEAMRARLMQEAAFQMQASGDAPIIQHNKNGFTVMDGKTGEEVGKAATPAEAMRIAQAHTDYLKDIEGDFLDYMVTYLEGIQAAQELSPDSTSSIDMGKVGNQWLLEAGNEKQLKRFFDQASRAETAASGESAFNQLINGFSEVEFKQGVRQTINRVFNGGNINTLVHEIGHDRRRKAYAKGMMTKAEEIAIYRGIDKIMGDKVRKVGRTGDKDAEGNDIHVKARMRLIPEEFTDDALIPDDVLDEAFSRVLEMEVLRGRQGGKKRTNEGLRNAMSYTLPSNVITKHFTALARLAPGAAQKFKHFMDAMKTHLQAALPRVILLKKAIRDGKFDVESYDAFLAKMMGLDLQDDHNARVDEEAARIYTGDPRLSPEAFAALGDPNQEDVGDDIPFSLSRARGKNAIQFATPIQTPLGNVVGYEWQSKVIEQDSGGVEGIVLKRVSDWDKAVTNAETGRDIVHHFLIEKPDGTTSTVSLESTLKQAGAEAKNIKGIVTAARRLPMLEAEMEQLTADIADYEKRFDAEKRRVSDLTPPEPSWQESEFESVRARGQANMMVGDVFVSVEDKSKPFPRDRVEYGRNEWKRSQMDVGMKSPDYDRQTALKRLIRKDREKLKSANVTDLRLPTSDAPAFSLGRATVQVSNDTRAFQGAEGSPSVIGPAAFSIRAWHGTPHKVDKFTTEKIGTGEGAQAYGWGLYFAEDHGVARSYRNNFAQDMPDGPIRALVTIEMHRSDAEAKEIFHQLYPDGDYDSVKKEAGKYAGNLYTVTLKVEDEDLLDWDKPLSEQSEKVRNGVREFVEKRILIDFRESDLTGPALSGALNGFAAREASEVLASAGIRGIRYLDGNSRNRPLRDIKRDFLEALPENAEFEDVAEAIQAGAFNPQQAAFLDALKADDWFGFDYPAQAISAALSDKVGNWDASQTLIDSIAPLRGDVTYNYVIFSDADIEIVEENGTPVDLGTGGFSLAPSRVLDLMQMNALDRVRNPRRRAKYFTQVSREMQRLKLAAERVEIVSGTKRLRKSLLKEAAMREAKAREDLEADVYARFWQIFADEDLVKIKSQPVHAALADPDSPLRGRLMSRTAAMKHRAELFGEDYKGGEWDGSDGLSRALFGGQLTPDQAAQELYDAGLIKDPYVDTMWQALHAEQNTVAGMKEQLAKAQEQLREARMAAKEEANAWLKHAAKGQQETFNPREEILRMVASLEAILRPLPPAVRVKVGGYQQMIRIASTEGQLKFLREQIAKADKELEKWMRVTIGQEFRELMEKTKPERDEAGKRPKGKIGADIHDIFRSIDAAIYLDGAETEAEATRLETLADADTTSDEQRAHLMMEANLVRLTGNWAKADSARREAALEAATNAYYGGYMAAQMKAAGRRARNDFRRADLKAATGKTQNPQERADEEVKSLGTKLGRAKQAVFSLFSFDQMMGLVFGTDSETAKLFTEWELRAANAKEDAMQRSHDAVESLLTDLAGGELAGEKLRHKLATERSVKWTDHKGREQTATEMEAISYTLMWRQEDGKRHMEGIIEEKPDGSTEVLSEWHWREEDIEAIEKQLSKEAKAIRMFLTDSYAAEYDRINAVFSDLYGVNMPRHKDYSPIKVAPSHAAGGQTADPVSGTMQGPGLTPGSLKNRSHSAVAEPARIDALQHFVAHTKQMEHFIAYAAFSTELMAVVNNREVGNTIEAKAGKEAVNVIRGWADYFAQGGTRDAAAHLAASHWFQRGLDRISQMALVGRASVLAIQSVQLGAALYQMPVGSYMKRLAKLSTGQLGWGKAIRSDYIQRRLSQMPPAVQQAMAGLAAGSPSRIKHATAKLGRLISGADALFTAGTYAMIYDYQLTAAKRMGIPNPEAFAEQEAIRLTDQVAQPMRAGARSMMEVTSTNPAFRMMWAFASEPRQKIALAVHQAMTKKGAGRFRAAGVTWLVSGMAAAILRSAIRDLRDDGEDDEVFDEKNWSPERLILASLAGPLGGFPLIGKEIESALYTGAGEYMPGGSLIGGPTKAVGTVKKLATGKGEWEDAIKDTETILGGVGVAFPNAAAATSWTHIARDVEGIIRNLTE